VVRHSPPPSVRAVRSEERPARFQAFVAATVLLVVVAIVITLLSGTTFFIPGAIALVILAVIAANRDAVFSDETAISGSILVVCASVVGFGATSLAVPVLCAVGASLHRDHLRQRQLQKVLVNVGATVVPALAATGYFRLIAEPGWLNNTVAIAGVVAIYWLLNNAFVGLALALARDEDAGRLIAGLIKSDTVMLVFAVGGALCGLVMTDVGTWVGIAALTASLVALDVFVIAVPAGPAVLRSAWKMLLGRMIGGVAAGLVAVAVTVSLSGAVGGAVAGLVAGIVVGTLIVVGVAVARLVAARHSLDLSVLAGFALAELPLIAIAAIAGVVAALAGAASGFLVASALVILGSLGAAWRRRHERAIEVDDDVLLAAAIEAILDGVPDPTPRR